MYICIVILESQSVKDGTWAGHKRYITLWHDINATPLITDDEVKGEISYHNEMNIINSTDRMITIPTYEVVYL
jgi:hypothetical protein